MEEHLVELDSLKFLPFNYKRLPNYNPSSANIFGMSFGLFMIATPMMGWIDYNSPTLGSILCFGGICEYIIGFFNWYDGRGIQSFIDFVFGLLHLTIYYTTELGKYSIPIPYEYYTYMQGTFYIIFLGMLLFLFISLFTRGIMYIVNTFFLFCACVFALTWHFSKKTWCRKASGYFIGFASFTLWLTGLYHLLNGVFREPLVPTMEPEP